MKPLALTLSLLFVGACSWHSPFHTQNPVSPSVEDTLHTFSKALGEENIEGILGVLADDVTMVFIPLTPASFATPPRCTPGPDGTVTFLTPEGNVGVMTPNHFLSTIGTWRMTLEYIDGEWKVASIVAGD